MPLKMRDGITNSQTSTIAPLKFGNGKKLYLTVYNTVIIHPCEDLTKCGYYRRQQLWILHRLFYFIMGDGKSIYHSYFNIALHIKSCKRLALSGLIDPGNFTGMCYSILKAGAVWSHLCCGEIWIIADEEIGLKWTHEICTWLSCDIHVRIMVK